MGEATIRRGNRESQRAAELVELGVDSPLKLDLIAAIECGADRYEPLESLAASCGLIQREARAILDDLATSGLVECRRLYNLTEYGASPKDELRARILKLIGTTPAEQRRIRRDLLERVNGLG